VARGAARIHSCIDHVTSTSIFLKIGFCSTDAQVTETSRLPFANNAGDLLRAVAPIAFWAPSSSLTEPDLVAYRSPVMQLIEYVPACTRLGELTMGL
jgi:hypothetical protein